MTKLTGPVLTDEQFAQFIAAVQSQAAGPVWLDLLMGAVFGAWLAAVYIIWVDPVARAILAEGKAK